MWNAVKCIFLLLNMCNSLMCHKNIGHSGKIQIYPNCNMDSYIEINIDYVRELDVNNKKIPKHFKENIASTNYMYSPITYDMLGLPQVNTSHYNLTSCLIKNKKNNICNGELLMEIYFFYNDTKMDLMNVSKNSMKFNIIINNWKWQSINNKIELGMDMLLNGHFKNMKNESISNNIIDLNFHTFNYKTPTINGANCGKEQKKCNVYFDIQKYYLRGYDTGPSPYSNTGPSPSSNTGPSPSSNVYNILKYKMIYTFPYFGNKLVYDPVISSNPTITSTGYTSYINTSNENNSNKLTSSTNIFMYLFICSLFVCITLGLIIKYKK